MLSSRLPGAPLPTKPTWYNLKMTSGLSVGMTCCPRSPPPVRLQQRPQPPQWDSAFIESGYRLEGLEALGHDYSCEGIPGFVRYSMRYGSYWQIPEGRVDFLRQSGGWRNLSSAWRRLWFTLV